MANLKRTYRRTIFNVEVIQEAVALIEALDAAKLSQLNGEHLSLLKDYCYDSKMSSLCRGTDFWRPDSFEEFFADYRKGFDDVMLSRTIHFFKLEFTAFADESVRTVVEVSAPSRAELERVFDIFDRSASACQVESDRPKTEPPVIFIGHGRNAQWRDLKDHMQDKHHYAVQAYEVGARAGHTIRDILDEMLSKSSFALLVFTAEDETAEGSFNPRMNVVHELGLFQGRLGFPRAIVLLEDGTAEFSNIHGIQQIRFGKANIKETFGEVLATVRREFL